MSSPLAETEAALLGAIILSRDSLNAARSYKFLLHEDAFIETEHKYIASVICALAEKGMAPDLVTIKHELSDRIGAQGKTWLELSGGEDTLISVAEAVPSASNIDHYASIIKARWQRRRILQSSHELAEFAKNPDVSISEVIAKAQEVSAASASLMPRSVFAHISEIEVADSKDIGIPTGISGLDSQIGMNGYPAGQLSVVRAYHKGGKSTFLIQSALHAASSGYKVLYATFADLHRKHIKRRLMRMLTGSMYPPETDGLFGDWHKMQDELHAMQLDIYDVAETDDGGTVEEFVAWATSRSKTHGAWDAIFVDYAQELTSGSRRISGKMEDQMECARILNRFASQTKAAVVVGSQITTDLMGGKRTKWGRDWEEKAGWVLTISPPGESGLQSVEISYSRFGYQHPKSVDVPVRFNSQLLTLDEA